MRFAWIAGVMLAATAASSASADVIYPRGLVRAPETLDPQKAATFNETPLLYDLFEGLVGLDAAGNPVPGAAESWTISPDGLVYTFALRPGARWSNGDVVKAADFVASFRRLFAPATGATENGPLLVIKNAAAIQQGTAEADALGVAAIDANTLEITLERPVPTFLRRLTLPVALPVNVATIKKLGADFGTTGKIVSNGAYRLAAIDKKDGYILVKNARFRDAKAMPIDSVVYKTFESPADCVEAFRAKTVLSCPDVPTDQLAALREEFGPALHFAPYPGTYYYAFNTTKKPFDNIVVRRALAMAIDREALAASVWSGGMIPTYMVLNKLHMTNTLFAVILLPAINIYNLVLMRNFFEGIPHSLFEAAEIDGCTPMQTFLRIVLPLSKAALAAIGLMFAVAYWNDYTNFKIYITKENLYNFQMKLRSLIMGSDLPSAIADATESTVQNAAVMVAIIPFMIIYPFCQKYFISGINIGAVKE